MIRGDFDRLRGALGECATRNGMRCTVLFMQHRSPGDCGRWAKPPTPRAAVAYLDTSDTPAEVAARMIDLIVDANRTAGVTFDEQAIVAKLAAAARPHTKDVVA